MAVAEGLSETRAPIPPRGKRRRIGTSRLTVLLFMAPWILGFLAFVLYPMLATLYFSFTKYNLLQPPHWVGLLNYRHMFTSDPNFWLSVRNTVWIVVFGIPMQVAFAIVTALALTRLRRGVGVPGCAANCVSAETNPRNAPARFSFWAVAAWRNSEGTVFCAGA